jgi:hypothetical protein
MRLTGSMAVPRWQETRSGRREGAGFSKVLDNKAWKTKLGDQGTYTVAQLEKKDVTADTEYSTQ